MTLIETAIIIDSLVFLVCLTLLLRHGRLSHSHTGTIYLIFHFLVVTLRLYSINSGTPTLFDGPYWGSQYEPVTYNEIVRATIMADVALVVMTIAWLRASAVDIRKRRSDHPHDDTFIKLKPRIVYLVSIVALPMGIVGMALLTYIPGVSTGSADLGAWGRSGWIGILPSWVGLSLLAMMYLRGFRWWLMIPMALYLVVMAIQGYHRFRVVIPIILMTQMYLDQRGLKWPPLWLAGVLFACGILFLPLKTIGRMVQQGATPAEIINSSTEIVTDIGGGGSDALAFLDQFASTVTQVDKAGRFYYGQTYLPLLTLPIPRPLWPDKPALNEYQWDIQTPTRPSATMGMISLFLGEAYANFGYLGIIIIPYLFAYWMARWYFRVYSQDRLSIGRFAYLLMAANLIQIYRDGLVSLMVFTLVNMMPLTIVVALHAVPPLDRTERLQNRLMRLEKAKKIKLMICCLPLAVLDRHHGTLLP